MDWSLPTHFSVLFVARYPLAMNVSPSFAGLGYGLLAAAAFGSMSVGIKLSYRAGVTPGTMSSLRVLLGAASLGVFLWATRRLTPIPIRRTLTLLIVGAVTYGPSLILGHVALSFLPVSTFELILYTYPSIVAVLAFYAWRERLRGPALIALPASLLGVLLIFGFPHNYSVAGASVAFGGALAYALYALSLRSAADSISPPLATLLILTGAAVSVTSWALLTRDLDFSFSAAGWIWPLLNGCLLGSVGQAAFVAAVGLVGPTRSGVIMTFEPVATTAAAVVVLGEFLTPQAVFGGMLIVVAAVLAPFGHETRP
jgi:drug/metabolite transporter (DMT)-like permease